MHPLPHFIPLPSAYIKLSSPGNICFTEIFSSAYFWRNNTCLCASAQSPCSIFSLETLTDNVHSLLGVFAWCSFTAEQKTLCFQSSTLPQCLADIPLDLLRDQQMQGKFKILQDRMSFMKDFEIRPKSPHLPMFQTVSSCCLVYLSFLIDDKVKRHKGCRYTAKTLLPLVLIPAKDQLAPVYSF